LLYKIIFLLLYSQALYLGIDIQKNERSLSSGLHFSNSKTLAAVRNNFADVLLPYGGPVACGPWSD